jgi:putative ABC transport system ATP-binding protein
MESLLVAKARGAVAPPEQRHGPPVIRLVHVRKSYTLPTGEPHTVFESASFEVVPGEFAAVTGPVGSGKTTLFKLIAGLTAPDAGLISVGGVETVALTARQLAALRGRMFGLVFQTQSLIPELTVTENVELPLFLRRVPTPERQQRAAAVLDQVGLAGHAARPVPTLSVGERQLAAIARALVTEPPLLMMDEPTEALDPLTSEIVIGLLRGHNLMRDRTLVITTHDPRVIEVAHRVIRVKKHIP